MPAEEVSDGRPVAELKMKLAERRARGTTEILLLGIGISRGWAGDWTVSHIGERRPLRTASCFISSKSEDCGLVLLRSVSRRRATLAS